eukprot:1455871-Lingulodinium_polyedra.AAC.1
MSGWPFKPLTRRTTGVSTPACAIHQAELHGGGTQSKSQGRETPPGHAPVLRRLIVLYGPAKYPETKSTNLPTGI